MDGLMHVPKGHPTDTTTGLGWRVYAALMMSLSATVNIVWGVIALADNYYWGGDSAVSHQPQLWGWLIIGFGVLELLVVGGVLIGNGLAYLVGIALVLGNTVVHLHLVDEHPGWALAAIGANALVVYALAKPWVSGE